MGTAPTSPRKSIDCRQYPSEINCTLKISGTEDEVLQASKEETVPVTTKSPPNQ